MENGLIKNKYKIQQNIARGSFGCVYKVLNIEDTKEYVIKVIELNDTNETEKANIKKEGELLSKLNSEYVVKYYDSFFENSKYYLVMEYCNGVTLAQILKNHKNKNVRISEEIIINIFRQILLGLKEIHDHNIIHRDLKPANIFLTKDQKVKIGDLGISKEIDQNKQYAQTIIGTVLYMSPEIIQGLKYTNKTDIWSAGCILYELCTLDFIFPSTSPLLLLDNILNEKPKEIEKIYGDELIRFVDMLLEKDPLKRPDINMAINEIEKCKIELENYEDKLFEIIFIPMKEKNNIIENILQQNILNQSIFSVEKESLLSKILPLARAVLVGAIGFIPVINLISCASICVGVAITGSKKDFIDDNIDILSEIFNYLTNKIKKEIDLQKIEKEGIITLTASKFNDKMIKIKHKFSEEKYIKQLKNKIDNSFNILLLGNTNAGKSTLINSFLKLSDENKAKEGEGLPTETIEFKAYQNVVNGNLYILHDTNGITNIGEHCAIEKMKKVQEEINKRIEKEKANQLIHCIWYCIAGTNVQDSDKELVIKLNSIYTTKQIPIIFIHTKTFSKIDSKKVKAGLTSYLTTIYNDPKKAEDYLNTYYIDILAKDYPVEIEDEDGEIITKVRKPFGLDKLEELSKKEIKENGIKSAYFEYLKKDIIPILINAVYTQVFIEKNIKKLGEASTKSIDEFLKTLISIVNGSDPELNEEIKINNEKAIKIIYNEFDRVKSKLFDTLKNDLTKKNLEIKLKEFVEDCYKKKSEEYKKKYSLEKFKNEVSSSIFAKIEKKDKEIINNITNHNFNYFVMETLKNGLRNQFASKEEQILNEIYEQLFKY